MKLSLIDERIRKKLNFVFMQTMKISPGCQISIIEKNFDFTQT